MVRNQFYCLNFYYEKNNNNFSHRLDEGNMYNKGYNHLMNKSSYNIWNNGKLKLLSKSNKNNKSIDVIKNI